MVCSKGFGKYTYLSSKILIWGLCVVSWTYKAYFKKIMHSEGEQQLQFTFPDLQGNLVEFFNL